MVLSDKIKAFNHGTGPIKMNANPGKIVMEGRPTELHLKEDGDKEDKPSFAIVIEDSNGNKVIGQVSLKMLSVALHELGYAVTSIAK